jgi:methylmalonyl-CoA mutase, C-terminal domain
MIQRKIKVLLAKLGLDVHNRGIITVAKILSQAGMEVIYIGNATPGEIMSASIQEDVDVIGVSSLCGAHLTLGIPLIREAGDRGIKDKIVFLIGGVFPPSDKDRLEAIGFDGVFLPGAKGDEIVETIRDLLRNRKSEGAGVDSLKIPI